MNVTVGKWDRAPTGEGRLCGSSLAHGNCRFAGVTEADLIRCGADADDWSACPYRQSGYFVARYNAMARSIP